MKFVDTNVLVYFVDSRDKNKQSVARGIVAEAIDNDGYVISGQVLNEFSNVAHKKLGLPVEEVAEYVEAFGPPRFTVATRDWTCRALAVMKKYDLQFYDSLLLVAAETAGCDTILTEDLNDGQVYNGVRAVNPFKDTPSTPSSPLHG